MYITQLALLSAVLPCAFSAPPQPHIANVTKLPTHFGAIIFPHFQALDLIGPLDVLNSLSMLYKNETTMKLTVLSKTMAPVSTGMGPGSFGELFQPTMTFRDYLDRKKAKSGSAKPNGTANCDDGHGGHAVAKRAMRFENRQMHDMPVPPTSDDFEDIEVLIVPGGGGTRGNMTEEIAFVKEVYPKLKYIISVCTGASILARAGILDGKLATTNKRAWDFVTGTAPNTTWVPTARWVEDGNIWSSSGISAGIDVTYAWISHVYSDPVADHMSKSLEYERQTDEHHDPFGKIWDVPGAV
jgi:putative intracellular protease/amidase